MIGWPISLNFIEKMIPNLHGEPILVLLTIGRSHIFQRLGRNASNSGLPAVNQRK